MKGKYTRKSKDKVINKKGKKLIDLLEEKGWKLRIMVGGKTKRKNRRTQEEGGFRGRFCSDE